MGVFSFLESQISSSTDWLINSLIPPPPTKICGSDGGPPITAKRILLKDGRHLAYAESGVNKADARIKIVFCHGYFGSRFDSFRTTPELIEELGVYIVGFDRAGYGESDPDPNRTIKSSVLDAAELADALGLGQKFYMVGSSIGCHVAWGAIKYIPERLEGVVLLGPLVNYRWPGFPPKLASAIYKEQKSGDQWVWLVAYYAPRILHWWMDQTWLPASSIVDGTTFLPNKFDDDRLKHSIATGNFQKIQAKATQQGKHESIYRETIVMHGKWEFDPMDLPEPPFPVHIFQGDEDGFLPVKLQRYLADKLKWVNYHELPGTGHFLISIPKFGDEVLKTVFVRDPQNKVSV